ncbi:MAG: hypothetical protein JWN47_205, partial [Frankiales bacterium]|nr:hypothetical protein [Frankiales bacterium]
LGRGLEYPGDDTGPGDNRAVQCEGEVGARIAGVPAEWTEARDENSLLPNAVCSGIHGGHSFSVACATVSFC